ncbi:MAG: PucR family transcriptional regulator [Acetanaerobacterium sp.]
MATVQQILELPQLKGLKVIAGQSGLDRKVSCVTVMEVPDILQWLKGNDFLITSLYSVRDSVKSQCDLIESLAKESCSCIAVKTGQYVKQIEQPLCDMADKYGLPLVIIPYHYTYIELIINVASLILEETNMDAIMEKYVRDIVFDTYDDASLMIERGQIVGVHPLEHQFTAMAFAFEQGAHPGKKDMDDLSVAVSEVARWASQRHGFFYSPRIVTDENVCILIEAEDAAILLEFLPALKKQAQLELAQHPMTEHIKIGIGTVETGLDGIKTSYFNALRTIRAGQIFRPEEQVLEYQEMELYCLFNNAIYSNSHSLADNVLGKIDNKEILDTLVAYYECNANLDKTAQRLFAHRNTVKYRLARVKEITGLDVKNLKENFHLYLAVLAKRIQDNNTRI